MDYFKHAELLPYFSHFLAIAKAESISKAAKSLHLTQSALSKSLDKLEAALGVSLFERRRGSIALNSNGYILLSNMEQALGIIDDALNIIWKRADMNQVQISFASSSAEFILEIMNGFSSRNPDLCVNQIYAPPNQLVTMLIDNDIDFAISSVGFPIANVTCIPLFEDSIVFLAAKSFLSSANPGPELLLSHSLLCCNSMVDIHQLLQKCDLQGYPTTIAAEAWDLDFLLSKLKYTDYMLPLPRYTAQKAITKAPELVPIRFPELALSQPTILSFNEQNQNAKNAVVLVKYIQNYFANLKSNLAEFIEP